MDEEEWITVEIYQEMRREDYKIGRKNGIFIDTTIINAKRSRTQLSMSSASGFLFLFFSQHGTNVCLSMDEGEFMVLISDEEKLGVRDLF